MSSTKPKVILSAANINHYHYTALALQHAGYLSKYLCAFGGQNDLKFLQPFLPASYRKRLKGKLVTELDQDRIFTLPIPYLLTQALGRLHIVQASRQNDWFSSWYDRCTRHFIQGADVFHYVNSVGIKSAALAKQQKMILICDIRAAHKDVEDEILRQEYRQLGLTYRSPLKTFHERIKSEYQMADALIVPSRYVARTMINHGIPPERVHVVPYGLNVQRFSNFQYQPPDHKDNIFRVLFVGNVIPLKGLHYLIQAWESLHLPDSELLIVGRCQEPQYLALIKKLVNHTRVRFINHLPQVDLYRYYRQADVFALPSLSDSFALVVTEAMAAGLPVIVSEHTGASELIQNKQDGFIVPTGDCDALATMIQWCYQHRDQSKLMGELGTRHIQEFTWVRYEQYLLEAYDKIIGMGVC